ncbi:MAG: CHAT domain-containing protein [Deltaproteobacteria bacterium]|nr:CHAT domain-containing protein [Deltaproteobacteria bacterium]
MFGHQQRRLCIWAALWAVACRDPEPAALAVEISGCAKQLPGAACILDATNSLRVLLTEPLSDAIVAATDKGAASVVTLAANEGRLLQITVPASASTLTVTTTGGTTRAWSLRIEPPSSLMLRAREARDSGNVSAVSQAVQAVLDSSQGVPRARALSERARLSLRAGQLDSAFHDLVEAVALFAEAGHAAEACDDLLVLAYIELEHRGSYGESRKRLDEAWAQAPQYPDGQAHVLYFRGLNAAQTGDVRSALRLLGDAAFAARRLGFTKLVQATSMQLAQLYQQLGQWQAMFDRLSEAGDGGDSHGCQRADWLSSKAWALLMARESNEPDAASRAAGAHELVAQALKQYDESCPGSPNRDSTQLTAVIDDLQHNDVQSAKSRLASVQQDAMAKSLPVALWWHELQGRVNLQERQFTKALAAYTSLEKLASASARPQDEWRATFGKARAYRGLGRTRFALEAFAKAQNILDDERRWVPVSEGRASLVTLREQSVREWIDLLLQENRNAEAIAVARRSIRQTAAVSLLPDQVARLTGQDRATWESAMARYRHEREQIAALSDHDWALSQRELVDAAVQRQPYVQRMLAALDDALAVLGPRVNEVSLRAPGADELMVVFVQAVDGYLAFAAWRGNTAAYKVSGSSNNDRTRAEALMEPLLPLPEGARSLTIIAPPGLAMLDFHAVMVGTQPLVALQPISYSLDLPPRAAKTKAPAAALVVADSQKDLPGSAKEGSSVASWLNQTRPTLFLSGDEVVRSKMLDELDRVGLFHYAGHALNRGPANLQGGLPLAEGLRLEIGDILALPHAPDEVVLSGCGSADAGATGVGIAQAFILAGASLAIATTRAVRDEDAFALFRSFYRGKGAADLSTALRRAQLALLSEPTAKHDWAAFRAIAQ